MSHLPAGQSALLGPRTFNRLDVAAQAAERAVRHGAVARPYSPPTGTVLVRNDSGADAKRYGVLGIDELVISRADNNGQFKSRRFAFSGVAPGTAHLGKFVITAQSIANSAFGRAWLDGIVICPVRMVDEGHVAADVDDGQLDHLASAASGALQLLWVEPLAQRESADIAWCIGRFGAGNGGAATGDFALITSKAGSTVPYRYSAEGITSVSIAGELTAGGATYNNVFNLEELGIGGQWVNALNIGDPVELREAPGGNGVYLCSRSHYRGGY